MELADMIKLKKLRWKGYLSIHLVIYAITNILHQLVKGGFHTKEETAMVAREVETGVMQTQAKECQKLDEAKHRFSPGISRGSLALPIPLILAQ